MSATTKEFLKMFRNDDRNFYYKLKIIIFYGNLKILL